MTDFLRETSHLDFSAPNIQSKTAELFHGAYDDIQKARVAYEFVRDEIPHTFDIGATTITAKASDVLEHKTGICHAKSVLLAALLRSQGIPTGFCFQHVTLMADDSKGYCVHGYNAVWLNGRWIKLDARGNTNGRNAQFSIGDPMLAFPCRPEYHEYHWPGVYADPHAETMAMLGQADSIEYIIENIPDEITLQPDAEIEEKGETMNAPLKLTLIPIPFSVCKLPELPLACPDGEYVFLTKAGGETSLVCETAAVPVNATAVESGWRALVVEGPLDFGLIGILAGLTSVLAAAGVSVFAVSTYETDYILVKEARLSSALKALAAARYEVADG